MKLWTALLVFAATVAMALPAAAARKKPQQTPRPQQYIACTPAGCHPTPPGCHPEIGFDPWGNPTGYDIVVCPQRR